MTLPDKEFLVEWWDCPGHFSSKFASDLEVDLARAGSEFRVQMTDRGEGCNRVQERI